MDPLRINSHQGHGAIGTLTKGSAWGQPDPFGVERPERVAVSQSRQTGLSGS